MSELPPGWTLATLGELGEWGSGGTPSRRHAEYFGGPIPWLKTGELGPRVVTKTEETLTHEGLEHSSAKIFPEGAVAIAMYGATIGKTSILGIRAATNQACAVIQPNADVVTAAYLYHYLVGQQPAFVDAGKGGAQPNISQTLLKEWPISLAPLKEQRRIADKLDVLLAQVDACRERLDRVSVIVKRFRQAVLAAATSGRLTEDWRDNAGSLNWSQGSFMDFFDIEGGTQPPKSAFVSEPKSGYVRLLQIRDFGTRPVPTYIPDRKGLKKCERTDVLLGRYGASVGKVCTGMEGAYNVALAKVCPLLPVAPGFVAILLATPDFYLAINGFQRSAQDGFNKSDLKQIDIAIPRIPEQQEIVRRVELLFSYADRLEQRIQATRARVERLTPALLAKAFRGELVPQDPNDESAEVLLERLRQSASDGETKRRSGRKSASR